MWLLKERFGVLWGESPRKRKQVILFKSSVKGIEDTALELELEFLHGSGYYLYSTHVQLCNYFMPLSGQ